MRKKTILLVEDNKDVQAFNKFLLEEQGFNIETAMTLHAARKLFIKRAPDAIVLDIGMPDGNGLDFLKELRILSKVPVLILTGYKNDDNIVNGFNSGCDDYLSKPYTFEVLLARLKRLLQSAAYVPARLEYGPLKIEVLSGQAFLNGEDMLLTQKEIALLLLFTQNEGRFMSAEYLYKKVWGQPMNKNVGAVKYQVSNLRKKLEDSGYIISSTRGEGYCFKKE